MVFTQCGISTQSKKLMGKTNLTATGFPLNRPGFQLLRVDTARTDSVSHSGLMPFTTLASLTFPCLSTTNITNTRPSVLVLRACFGYRRTDRRSFIMAFVPPLYSGDLGTTVYTVSLPLSILKSATIVESWMSM